MKKIFCVCSFLVLSLFPQAHAQDRVNTQEEHQKELRQWEELKPLANKTLALSRRFASQAEKIQLDGESEERYARRSSLSKDIRKLENDSAPLGQTSLFRLCGVLPGILSNYVNELMTNGNLVLKAKEHYSDTYKACKESIINPPEDKTGLVVLDLWSDPQ